MKSGGSENLNDSLIQNAWECQLKYNKYYRHHSLKVSFIRTQSKKGKETRNMWELMLELCCGQTPGWQRWEQWLFHMPFKLLICLMAVQTQETNLCARKKLEVGSEGHPVLLKRGVRPEIGGPGKIQLLAQGDDRLSPLVWFWREKMLAQEICNQWLSLSGVEPQYERLG